MIPVLVVDDEVQIRRLLRLYLEKEGYAVFEADTCEEGLRQFNALKPGIVLLDLGLPDGDGRELLQAVRKRGDTPVIILSVRNAEEDITGHLDAGADDYLIKPFGVGELSPGCGWPCVTACPRRPRASRSGWGFWRCTWTSGKPFGTGFLST